MLLAPDTFPYRQQSIQSGQGLLILAKVVEDLDTQGTGGQSRRMLLAPDTFLYRQQFIQSGQGLLILAKVVEDPDTQVADIKG